MTDETYIVRPANGLGNASRNAPITGTDWKPVVGDCMKEFLGTAVPPEARVVVRDSAVSILQKSVSQQDATGGSTGLVVGYVQSGKTMSFEGVTALARDNQFQMIILVTGISNPLYDQSSERIRKDFGIDDDTRARRWSYFNNPSGSDATVRSFDNILAGWKDPNMPEKLKTTILVTVLKNHHRLINLNNLLEKLNLDNVPTLIIDDEADQASLDTRQDKNQPSSTYSSIMRLRHTVPVSCYLQYTATPQAPLLLNILDALSPDFVEVLNPGGAYVGGKDFFLENENLIVEIPEDEVPTKKNYLLDPPKTLLDALCFFVVGVAIEIISDEDFGNRSMLIHPSHYTDIHNQYYRWVMEIFENWREIIESGSESVKSGLIKDFKFAFGELSLTATVPLPSFEEVVDHLKYVFLQTEIREVNSKGGKTPEINWRDSLAWILVGGQALERGYTVEGLTITYMPRTIGTGNADVIQQRARFFGYKRKYMGLCRVFLNSEVIKAYKGYVTHEEEMRKQLEDIQQGKISLKDWKRAFILDDNLQPCRANVIEYMYRRRKMSRDWIWPRRAEATDDVLQNNRDLVVAFCDGITFKDDIGHKDRRAMQKHKIAENVSLNDLLNDLIIPYRITGYGDSDNFAILQLYLAKVLEEQSDAVCDIYRMGPEDGSRRRGLDEDGRILELFQGAYPVEPIEDRGSIYPGDSSVYNPDKITVQIHMLNITRDNDIISENVPVIAVHIPENFDFSWIIQHQPPQSYE